ncbi:MAG: acetate/propionate family kinase [Hyphomicrobiaceae bacterium]
MHAATLLTLNAGSSSIKFALFDSTNEQDEIARGQVENIGAAANMRIAHADGTASRSQIPAADHDAALRAILGAVQSLLGDRAVAGVGHRITHGGPDFAHPRELDVATLARLREFIPWAPLHQPYNLAVVDGARAVFPAARQIGCFDTAFHRGHDFVADCYALPRAYYDKGVRRYGFHGLSYQYIAGRLREVAPEVVQGRVVVAHLGNGASMCALRDGKSVACTMGFTALDGLAMGTRCGQIDPGVLLYLLAQERMTVEQLADLLYRRSGLLGLSGLSNDMRTLLESPTPEARQALDYFVHRARMELGSLASVLSGLDALVFCGGIGENSPDVRARICDGLEFLGVEVAASANVSNSAEIGAGACRVLVVPTFEERVMARALHEFIGRG